MRKEKVGCARPTGGPVGEPVKENSVTSESEPKEVRKMIKVGKKAPDFEAPAYFKGEFVSVNVYDSVPV